MPDRPPLYDIFWGHIFCKYGGWGWSELFSGVVTRLLNLCFHCESEGEKNPKIFICNNFHADGMLGSHEDFLSEEVVGVPLEGHSGLE